MLSSTSVQKFQHEKKPKKKHRKFSNGQIKEGISFIEKIENEISDTVWKKENTRKSSNGFFDLKDFPELKVFRKHSSKSPDESNSSELKTNKPLLPAFTGENQKKSIETFPTLLVTENHERDELNLKENEQFTESILEEEVLGLSKTIPKAEFGKQINASNDTDKKKVSSSKKVAAQSQKNIKKKKRADPVFINFQDIVALNKIQKKRKQRNILGTRVQRFKHKEFLSGNFLDSSSPKRSRGKHREIKKKKLTTFKMTIIKERILKKKMKEMAIDTHVENGFLNLINTIDFNSEIKTYLNELKEKKIKDLKSNKNKMKENVVNVVTCSKKDVKGKNTGTRIVEKKEENSEISSDVKEKKIFQVVSKEEIKFSSKFREYCDNIVTPELNSAVAELIKELIKLQDRLFSRDPIKARVKKRHVSGIREVRKYLTLKKVKLIIIAPNLEKLQMEGSVYDSVNQLKSMANNQNVTYGFALDRYKLGRCTKKNVPVSAFAVLNYEGLESLYRNVAHELEEAKKKFSELTNQEKVVENKEKIEDINGKVISSLISAFRENLRVYSEAESQSEIDIKAS